MSKWTDFVKAFASKHNMSYKDALSKAKDEYAKSKSEGGAIGDSFKKAFNKTANVVSSAAKDVYTMDLNEVKGLAQTTSPQEVVSYVNKAQGGKIGDSFKKAFNKTANVVSSAAKDVYGMDLNEVRELPFTTSPQEVVSYVNQAQGGKLSAGDLQGLLDASYDGRERVGDFIIDKALSTSNSKVYFNPATNKAVVAHKGTTGITDWGNNAVYALFGNTGYKQTQRFKDAEKVQKAAEKKYGASNISTIGHSQAGLQAELLGKKSNEIITLDKATRPFGNTKSKNQYDIRSSNDIVSAANPFQKDNKKEIVLKNKSLNPLVAHDIGQLSKLDSDTMIGQGICAKCMKKRMMKGGRISNSLLLLPDLVFKQILESIGDWQDLQSIAATFRRIINEEEDLTEDEERLVTERLELVYDRIEEL